MGRVALQEFQIPSQHVYRSLRRLNARKARESDLLHLQLQLSQQKFENESLCREVWWWRSWYNCDSWEEEYGHHIQHGQQGANSSSGDGFEKEPVVAGQDPKQTPNVAEEQYCIEVLLRELGALTAGVSDEESTKLGSVVSGSVFDDVVEDSCSNNGKTCECIVGTMSKEVSACMGRGRGLGDQDQGGIGADSRNAKAGRVRSSIGCGRGWDASTSGSSGDSQRALKMIAKNMRTDMEAAFETMLKTMLHNYTCLDGVDGNG